MLIAQISDLHIGVEGDIGAKDNYERLLQTFETLKKLQPQPDIVIATGDLTESGSVEAYRLLKRMFDATPFEIWPCMGNHDRRAGFRKVFSDDLFDGDYLQYAIDTDELRIIVLDTLGEGIHGGDFTEDQAEWLDALLSDAPTKPTVIALHHPPIYTGIAWMTAYPDDPWVVRLRGVIEKHPQVKKMISGHIHRTLSRKFAGTSVCVSNATAAQVGLDLSPIDPDKHDDRPLIIDEPPGFTLHFWDGEEIVTHRGLVGDFPTIVGYGPNFVPVMNDVFKVRKS
jgi:3',5'-cyclic AMP phosphodiesterase CpdA